MKKVIIILAVVLLILLGIAGGIYWMSSEVNNAFKPNINNQVVEFEKVGEKVYIRAMSWGISGNHNEVMLSTKPIEPDIRKSEKEKDYIFYTTELYYKKKGIDTLWVYTPSSSIGEELPSSFSEKIKVVLTELKTFDELRDYEQNYKEYGLSKISVYPNNE